MGEAYLVRRGGSGAALNFKIIGSTTQPSNPKENTIWVDTSAAIAEWVLDAVEPEMPTEGLLWIQLGTKSNVGFNVLKKNAVWVYPISAKHYVDDTWVNCVVKSYRNGEWVDWIEEGTLYSYGMFHPDVAHSKQPPSGVAEYESDGIAITIGGSGGTLYVYEVFGPLDLSQYSKVVACLENNSGNNSPVVGAILVDSSSTPSAGTAVKSQQESMSIGSLEITLDISAVELTGGYLAVGFNSGGMAMDARSPLVIRSVKLEE